MLYREQSLKGKCRQGILIKILYLFIILKSGLETKIKINININFGITEIQVLNIDINFGITEIQFLNIDINFGIKNIDINIDI